MTHSVLPYSNGANGTHGAHSAHSAHGAHSAQAAAWQRQSVRQFFSGFNWEDNPPEVQELRLQHPSSSTAAADLSLKLTVKQFFNAINWDNATIASLPEQPDLFVEPVPNGSDNDFTLEDFSDLF